MVLEQRDSMKTLKPLSKPGTWDGRMPAGRGEFVAYCYKDRPGICKCDERNALDGTCKASSKNDFA